MLIFLNITVSGCEIVIKTNTFAHVNYMASWKDIIYSTTTQRNTHGKKEEEWGRKGEGERREKNNE